MLFTLAQAASRSIRASHSGSYEPLSLYRHEMLTTFSSNKQNASDLTQQKMFFTTLSSSFSSFSMLASNIKDVMTAIWIKHLVAFSRKSFHEDLKRLLLELGLVLIFRERMHFQGFTSCLEFLTSLQSHSLVLSFKKAFGRFLAIIYEDESGDGNSNFVVREL